MRGLLLRALLSIFSIQWILESVLMSRVRACTDCGTVSRKQG